MFKWLANLFRRSEKWDVYNPGEMQIYSYFDGEKWVKADPVALYGRVSDKWLELEIDMKVSTSPSKDAAKAYKTLASKIREIFGIRALEEGFKIPEQGTLTDVAVLALLDQFLTYSGFVKKNSSPSQTTSTPSEVCKPTSPKSPPTSNTSACGSTGEPVSTAKQEPSITESKSPSV